MRMVSDGPVIRMSAISRTAPMGTGKRAGTQELPEVPTSAGVRRLTGMFTRKASGTVPCRSW